MHRHNTCRPLPRGLHAGLTLTNDSSHMPTVIRKTTKRASRSAADASSTASQTKKGIDRQQVLNAARELSNVRGVDGLSIKDIADRLGIRPPSVYAHFEGLPEIRAELAKAGHHALAHQLRSSAVAQTGAGGVIAVAKAYLAFIREQPGLYSAAMQPNASPEARAAAEEWLSVIQKLLESMGLSGEDRIHALRGIRSMVHGFGQLEVIGQFRTQVDRDASFDRMVRAFVNAIGRDPISPA